jgi:DNA-directed RNA polymerase subunit alpha
MSGLSGFAMPERYTIDEETATSTYARFFAKPLENGFGNTLGNALRRVLLSSLEGDAISSIQIDGVAHEFTAIQDVIEDVTEIVLNFKKIRLICDGEVPRTLELNTNKTGSVTAGDIELDSVTTIINPEQHLFTLDKERDIHITIELARGKGFRVAEENKREDHPIGVIPIDCMFSPVTRVAYVVHQCRVGQRTDYDLLELEVWSDRRIEPEDGLRRAAVILQEHLNVFTGAVNTEEPESAELLETDEDRELLRTLTRSINDIELSVRAQNCLNNANIATLGELVGYSEAEMLKFRNFGQKSLNEIKEKIAELGLHLDFPVKESVRKAFESEVSAKGE